ELDPRAHRFIQADAREFVAGRPTERFQEIYLDPPTFSNSKRMPGTCDVQRHHAGGSLTTAAWLSPGARLVFVTNCRGFKLDPAVTDALEVVDLTSQTVPRDISRRLPHRCFVIKARDT